MGQNPSALMIARQSNDVLVPVGIDMQGALSFAQRHGKYAAGALSKTVYGAGNAAATTSSVALATTYVGCCLSNPAASGKNLIVQKVGIVLPVAAAAGQSVGLITGFAAGGITVHTTPITILSAFVGDATAPVAKLDAACTLVGTPAWAKWLSGIAAVAGAGGSFDIEGEIVIPPGGYCAIGTLIASGASGFLGSFSWEEVAQ